VRYGSELNVIAVQADANAMGCVRSPLALTMKEWKNQVLQENPIMHSSWRSRAICLAALAVIVPFVLSLSAAGQTIVIDGESKGRIFDGVGAISGGGGNSRLLIDYPEPFRSQILDYLFKPNYGASMQIFKVEIGADMDSTDGSEASHMHMRSDENYRRGYEWWLMEQARERNPQIKLVALPWGAPHWVGDGKYWSRDMIDYIIKWLKHAQTDHHLTIDYLGGRNEHGYNIQFYKDLRAALRTNGFADIKVIASDDWVKVKLWDIASEMKRDPEVNDAIDIVGVHGPWWSGYATPDALQLGKPIWDSEAHFDEKLAYNEVARNINRNYVAGQAAASIYWPIVSAMYDNLPYDDIGFIKCNQPWSGHYVVTPSLWVMAHTSQFTQPGWRYIDSASGFFSGDATGAHGSYVALKSPENSNFSLVVETVEAKGSETEHFKLAGFHQDTLHLWTTNLSSANPSDWFVKQADIHPVQGEFSLDLEPEHMYTVTTTTGQTKGDAVAPASAPLALPFADNFESYSDGKMPRYFSDMVGGFETAQCVGGRRGICLRQVVPEEPISWKRTANRPFTMVGNLDWQDYRVSTDILLEQQGSADLIGRLSSMSGMDVPNSYVLRVADSGDWSLLKTTDKGSAKEDVKEEETVLAAGKVSALGINRWHTLALTLQGARITAQIDRVTVETISDASFAKGMVGLGTVAYAHVEFDNFKVQPIGPGHARQETARAARTADAEHLLGSGTGQ
jgi:O-glycosyl hydrolase